MGSEIFIQTLLKYNPDAYTKAHYKDNYRDLSSLRSVKVGGIFNSILINVIKSLIKDDTLDQQN